MQVVAATGTSLTGWLCVRLILIALRYSSAGLSKQIILNGLFQIRSNHLIHDGDLPVARWAE